MFPLRDNNPKHGPAIVMWVLVLLNVLAFLYSISFDNEQDSLRFIYSYSFVPRLFFSSPLEESYRLLSSMFLHGGFSHILGNMFFLWVFGDNIEDRMGHLPFTLFYLLGGVIATLAHGFFSFNSATPMIGASGAVSAVLGAYIVLFPRQRVLTFIPPFFAFWLPAWLYIGYWGILQAVQAFMGLGMAEGMSGVAWWAHVGGFVFGMVAVRFFVKTPLRTENMQNRG